jgi:hypothetical protein
MLRCSEAVDLMGRESGEPPALRRRIALVVHLLMCRHCRAYRRGLERMRRVARAAFDLETGPDADEVEEVVAAVRREAESRREPPR